MNSHYKSRLKRMTAGLLTSCMLLSLVPGAAAADRAGGLSGTSRNQPFVKGDTGSQNFRIPALLTLTNGWVLAVSDIRWRTSADSPQNLDTIASLSRDGGATWDWEVVNYFDDMADTRTGQDSASFIDPAVLQAQDGTIHMVVDACPSYVGLMHGNKMGRESSGFDDQGRLLVAKGTAGQAAPTAKSSYTYYVDLKNSDRTYQLDGDTDIPLFSIQNSTSGSASTDAWVDAFLNVYVEKDGTLAPERCQQLGSSEQVQSNLFYFNSQWKAYPVFYIMHRSATVVGDNLVWDTPQFLDIKLAEDEAFTGVCPGRGLSFSYQGKERLIFPLYDNQTGTELASVIYSDDQGRTWTRGEHTKAKDLNGVGKTSESQVVALPDGKLRMYSRNTINYISYADSSDGGVTWDICQKDEALYSKNPGNGCMVSFVNVEGTLVSPDNQLYENLILTSYPTTQRKVGTVRLGSVGEDGMVTWLNRADDIHLTQQQSFAYSCVSQLVEDGKGTDSFGVLYEHGPGDIYYEALTVTDLLGEGWYLVHDTSEIPSISLNTPFLDLQVGESASVTAAVTPAGTPVVWTSLHPDIASVDNGTVTAKQAGAATITATITTSNGIVRSADLSVAVQDPAGGTVVLPHIYEDRLETIDHPSTSTYDLAADAISPGVYAIFHGPSGRTLYHQSGTNLTDQVGGSVEQNRLTLDSGFPFSRQLWSLKGDSANGFTIQSMEADGRYLNLKKVSQPNSKVPVTDTPQTLTVTASSTPGSYTISGTENGQTLYLAHDDTQQHYVSANPVEFQLYRQIVTPAYNTYRTSVTGLNALISYVEALGPQEQARLQKELTAARELAADGVKEYQSREEAQTAQEAVRQVTQTLYQAWQNLPVSHTVTFVTGEGSPVPSQTVENGKTAVRPQDPTRNGYRFDGWFTDSACTQAYDFQLPVTGDLTLYAKWTYKDHNDNTDSDDSGNSNDSGKPSVAPHKNPDGSVTSTVTRPDGTRIETTKYPDGSKKVVETGKDGTITTATTAKDGTRTEITEKKDGSSQTSIQKPDGSSSSTMEENGKVTARVELSQKAVTQAEEKKQAARLPMPGLTVTGDRTQAPTVTVTLPKGKPVKVEIPVESVTSGTVAVLVHSDGTEEVLKTSLATEHGITVGLSDGATVKIVDNSKTFLDVPGSHWGVDAVDFAASRELFAGTGDTTFSPDVVMNRAMILTVLARMEGVDTSAGATWYEAGIRWAQEQNISDGSNLEGSLTREQLAAMLYRYAGSPAVTSSMSGFSDGDTVSSWASNAMTWAVETGLITGVGGNSLQPQGQASRAQVAAILMRFIENREG